MKRTVIISTLLAVLFAACGDDTAATTSSAATTTSSAGTTTTAPATTTSEATTTTTAATTTAPASIAFAFDANSPLPEVFGAAGDPHGSGCVIDGDELPDGVWFGFADALRFGTIIFDLACFFTGDAAEAAASADGGEAFDFYISNQSDSTYAATFAPDAEVFIIDAMDLELIQIPSTDWSSAESYTSCPGEGCAVWLHVNGGSVTSLVEQYLP